ncbi:hypothetical protein [Actinomadura livida]|uniref:Uncharacterized protein n=1 Tax=Actinomadura livida TaxID=79909 RepID=A0A7W7MXK7_9ACTN|nr:MULTISPECIES: hypothetical protein [Actinomadura]MBB4774936.1 hypothetical protein [Actinomadura catellatispora]GGU05010.1 hypothetical protein GCM10010208_31370 [Actinomadura livida]
MPRQIVTASAAPSIPVLEHRVAILERRVALLTETVEALAATLETALSPAGDGDAGGPVSANRPEPDLLPLGS